MGINVTELTIKEWELMRICWKSKDFIVKHITDQMPEDHKRSYQIVKMQLDRLVEKGFLERKRIGPIWIYNTIKTKEDAILQATKDFVKHVLNGDLQPLCFYFSEQLKNYKDEDVQLFFTCVEKMKEEK